MAAHKKRRPTGPTLIKRKAIFINELAQGWSATGAAAKAGMSRGMVYDLREADPEFAAAWDAAIEAGTDVLEDEAHRRAVKGTDKPVFHQGAQCGTVREYSDVLAIFLLKGRRPAKFKDRVEHSGKLTLEELLGKEGDAG